ncbi:MAG: STAS/SEC14 domain-containing protein [Rhodocyclaceae bacterium]|jgi:hypothetical protein|nr:STAS/SEC14 domain-containing protein [Rhodocyclaceae bacterium]MBK6907937.1 STAS/SEC14 domain-containing protein [Rhodocyclaceae bacterium]
MITIDHTDSLISVAVLGEFTLGDFQEFEELVIYKARMSGPVRLFLDLTEMSGATLDMAWEEIKFSREHPNDFERIGIVTDSEWITWSAWLQRLFVNAELMVSHDADDVRSWLND